MLRHTPPYTPDFDRLPNFFLLGVSKSGSTSLHAYLAQHPAIAFASVKEPHFFDNPVHYRQGIRSYEQDFFRHARGVPWRGDASPSYFNEHTQVIPRLRAIYGDRPLKFVIIFREPVARAWSHYQHRVARGQERRPFAQAVADEQRRGSRAEPWGNYLDDGRYATHLRAWLQHFDHRQFHFLLTDDLIQDAPAAVAAIFTFLGIDPHVPIDTTTRRNQSGTKSVNRIGKLLDRLPPVVYDLVRAVLPSYSFRRTLRLCLTQQSVHRPPSPHTQPQPDVPPALRAELRSLYRPEIDALAPLIDRDLSHWLNQTACPGTESP